MRRILEGFGDLGQGRESFPTSPENDPDGVVRELSGRVVRGGSWNNNPRNARASNRNTNDPDNRNNNIGFRCAQRLPIWRLTFSRRVLPAGMPRCLRTRGPRSEVTPRDPGPVASLNYGASQQSLKVKAPRPVVVHGNVCEAGRGAAV